MKALHIDLETYSSEDLKTSGVYRYCESIDFEILIIAYALDDGPVRTLSLATGTEIPEDLDYALRDDSVQKHAHNANFERICLIQYGYDIPASSWSCSAIKAAYCGLPRHLERVSKALDLRGEAKSDGSALIRYFSVPVKPTKTNGQRHRNLPHHDPEKWAKFCQYCAQDVVAEMAVVKALEGYELPKVEIENYELDQKINDAGVLIDLPFAKKAIELSAKHTAEVITEMKALTGLANPNSVAQLKGWFLDKYRLEIKSLNKDVLDEVIERAEARGEYEIVRVLELRKLISKTSIKKYQAMLNCVCEDGRARGLLLFYGARTGRWAGRLIQLQNLPQNHIDELVVTKDIIKTGDYDYTAERIDEEDLPSILSQLIRTALIAPKGKTFLVADFSAIEARVIAWLAGEAWRMRVFESHGKIYEASAALMFGVPIESVTKGSDLRAKGKVAELALGYQGAKGALAKMGGEKMGLTEDDMVSIVKKWRKANPAIVALWKTVEKAAKRAVRIGKPVFLDRLTFNYDGKALTIELPSGRKLFYQRPGFDLNKYDQESLYYWGVDSQTKQWVRLDTYGGKLVENIVQAIARDLLADAMRALDFEGFDIKMHVHDEAVCEEDAQGEVAQDLAIMCSIMERKSEWASGLPLAADGYITPFYKKD